MTLAAFGSLMRVLAQGATGPIGRALAGWRRAGATLGP